MSRFSHSCGQHRPNLCLLASGVLPDLERARIENHLALCPACQKYYDEAKLVAAPLAHWEKSFSHLEPDQTMRARWAKDFQAAIEPAQPPRPALLLAFLDWCHAMVWPCRRIWTGFAAVWLVVLVVNFSIRDSGAMNSSRPSPEMVRAFLESEGFLAEFSRPAKSRVATPPQPSLPQPRSEQRPGISRT